jgi:hypothetical protein
MLKSYEVITKNGQINWLREQPIVIFPKFPLLKNLSSVMV